MVNSSMEPDLPYIKFFFLDASVIVKLFVNENEKNSDLVRQYFNELYTKFFTTNFCFFESLSALKRKWIKKEISKNKYRDCCRLLFAYIKERRIEIKEYPLENLHDFEKLELLTEKYSIDISDGLQLLSIKETILSKFAGESETTLITADENLAKAAKEESVKLLDLSK